MKVNFLKHPYILLTTYLIYVRKSDDSFFLFFFFKFWYSKRPLDLQKENFHPQKKSWYRGVQGSTVLIVFSPTHTHTPANPTQRISFDMKYFLGNDKVNYNMVILQPKLPSLGSGYSFLFILIESQYVVTIKNDLFETKHRTHWKSCWPGATQTSLLITLLAQTKDQLLSNKTIKWVI